MWSSLVIGIATWMSLVAASDTPSPSVRSLDMSAMVVEAMAASHPETKQQARLSDTTASELASILERLGDGAASHHRARRLHRLLHRDYLKTYRRDADGLDTLLETGEFNCLSSTLLYGLLARELGYDVVVLERPGHLLIGLELEDGRIEIETTSPTGFDRQPRSEAIVLDARSGGGRGANGGLSGSIEPAATSTTRLYPLEAMIGFAWLNAGWRRLEAGRALEAAERVERAARYMPYLEGSDDAQRILSRAFFLEYETGAFATAYRIARIEHELRPNATTSRDRLLAAAVKRVEQLVDQDRPGAAAGLAREVSRATAPGHDVARFGRRVWPVIAAAAVRLSDWSLASASADRYSRVEPDRYEAERFTAWIDERMRAAARAPTAATCDPEPGVSGSLRPRH
jgi:hypothetical protein